MLESAAMNNADHEKRLAALASLDQIEAGMRVGLGTGSTAEHMIRGLAERCRAGLSLAAVVPTSTASAELAESLGLPVSDLERTPRLDVTIDGADEVDPQGHLIKGGGGALLHEKIVASASKRFVVIVDSKKVVDQLGKFKVPVEVIPAARPVVAAQIERFGGQPTLRLKKDGTPFITQESNLILDCDFGLISDPPRLAQNLDGITGVVEHGLFVHLTDVVIVGRGDRAEINTKDRGV